MYIYFYSCPLRPYFSEKRSSLFNFKSPFQIKLNHGVLDRTHHLHQSTLILPSPLLSSTFLPLNALVCADVWLKKKHIFFLCILTQEPLLISRTRRRAPVLANRLLSPHPSSHSSSLSLIANRNQPTAPLQRPQIAHDILSGGREGKNMTPFIRSASISAPLFFFYWFIWNVPP